MLMRGDCGPGFFGKTEKCSSDLGIEEATGHRVDHLEAVREMLGAAIGRSDVMASSVSATAKIPEPMGIPACKPRK
jgi:hypothetical protein